MSTIVKSDDDCYFFFNATCTKGDACPFRHSSVAYGSDVVCSFWREGKCIKGANCKYRHMEIRKSRNKVECFFERQPGGCRKPYCPFLHSSRSKSFIEDTDVIANDSDIHSASGELFSSNKNVSTLSDQEVKCEGDLSLVSSNVNESLSKTCSTPPFSPTSSSAKQQPTSPSSTAATIGSEPVSFNIDIAEESENEPEEIGNSNERKQIKLTASNHKKEADFGIKTLEQIRMEKVFRQNDVNKLSEPEPSRALNKVSMIKLKRKSTSCANNNSNTITSPSSEVKIGTENGNKPMGPGFAVKSLDEIRREKEQAKQSTQKKLSNESDSDGDKPQKVIKIKRTYLGVPVPNEPPSKIIKALQEVRQQVKTLAEKTKTQYDSPQAQDEPSKVQPLPPPLTPSQQPQQQPKPQESQPQPQPQESQQQPQQEQNQLPSQSPQKTIEKPILQPAQQPEQKQPIQQSIQQEPEQEKLTSPTQIKPLTEVTPTTPTTPTTTTTTTISKLSKSPKSVTKRRLKATSTPNQVSTSTDIVPVVPQPQQSPPDEGSIKSRLRKRKVTPSKQFNECGDFHQNVSDVTSHTIDTISTTVSPSSRKPKKSRNEPGNDHGKKLNPPSDLTKKADNKSTKNIKKNRPTVTTANQEESSSVWNKEESVNEEANLFSKDEDLLEEDDLLDDEVGTVAGDVAIEDEDDEFLKEIEHVINS